MADVGNGMSNVISDQPNKASSREKSPNLLVLLVELGEVVELGVRVIAWLSVLMTSPSIS